MSNRFYVKQVHGLNNNFKTMMSTGFICATESTEKNMQRMCVMPNDKWLLVTYRETF